jgi:hypothetical protein
MSHIYSFPNHRDITGIYRPFDHDDEQRWQENSLYSRRHDGLYKSRLEIMMEELSEENDSE